jgi:hypothetical protein
MQRPNFQYGNSQSVYVEFEMQDSQIQNCRLKNKKPQFRSWRSRFPPGKHKLRNFSTIIWYKEWLSVLFCKCTLNSVSLVSHYRLLPVYARLTRKHRYDTTSLFILCHWSVIHVVRHVWIGWSGVEVTSNNTFHFNWGNCLFSYQCKCRGF